MIEALVLYGLWLGVLGVGAAIAERCPRLVNRIGKWVADASDMDR